MQIEYLLEISKILIPALISIIVIFLARHFERERDAELKIRERKIQIYEEFVIKSMNFVVKNCNANDKQKNKLFNEMMNAFDCFNQNLLFWGTDKVIKAYIDYKINSGGYDGNTAMINYEKFILVLREDIGHKNKNLKSLDLIKLFLRADQFDKDGNIIL